MSSSFQSMDMDVDLLVEEFLNIPLPYTTGAPAQSPGTTTRSCQAALERRSREGGRKSSSGDRLSNGDAPVADRVKSLEKDPELARLSASLGPS